MLKRQKKAPPLRERLLKSGSPDYWSKLRTELEFWFA